jgi:hypothetical protein
VAGPVSRYSPEVKVGNAVAVMYFLLTHAVILAGIYSPLLQVKGGAYPNLTFALKYLYAPIYPFFANSSMLSSPDLTVVALASELIFMIGAVFVGIAAYVAAKVIRTSLF